MVRIFDVRRLIVDWDRSQNILGLRIHSYVLYPFQHSKPNVCIVQRVDLESIL